MALAAAVIDPGLEGGGPGWRADNQRIGQRRCRWGDGRGHYQDGKEQSGHNSYVFARERIEH